MRYRLAVWCPRCQRPPALRVSGDLVIEARRWPRSRYVMDIECAPCRNGSDASRYEVTAAAFHDARPVEPAEGLTSAGDMDYPSATRHEQGAPPT